MIIEIKKKTSNVKYIAILVLFVFALLIFFMFLLKGNTKISVDVDRQPIHQPIQSPKEVIAKKQDCEVYREKIEKHLETKNFSGRRAKVQATHSLSQLFYSPKVDACLYVAMMTFFKDTNVQSVAYELIDAGKGEVLHKTWIGWDDINFEREKLKFANVVKAYKSL